MAKQIYINGFNMTVDEDELTYEQIVNLSPWLWAAVQPTVQYTRGVSEKPSGTVTPGQALPLQDGMVIDVVFTGNA